MTEALPGEAQAAEPVRMVKVPIRELSSEVTTLASCGGRRPGRFVPFHPGQTPDGLGFGVPNAAPAMHLHLSRLRDMYLLVGPGRDGTLVTSDGRFVQETAFFIHLDPALHLAERLAAEAIEVEEPMFLSLDGSWRNYYHWTLFGLGRSMIYNAWQKGTGGQAAPTVLFDHRSRHGPDWPIGFSAEVWRESARRAGVADGSRLFAPGVYRLRAVDVLWQTIDQPPFLCFFPMLYEGFARIATDIGRRGADRRLIVSRAVNPRLSAVAAEALRRLALHAGFEFVALETLTFAEQVGLFASARTVVAPHGAGLSNIVYAAPDTRVIELIQHVNGEAGLRPWFYLIAAGLGHSYSHLDLDAFGGDAAALYGRIVELDRL